MFISLGILAGLLFIGTLWSILFRIGGRAKQPNALGKHLTYIVKCNSNSGTMTSLLSLPTCVAEGQVFKKRLLISKSYSLDAAAVIEGMTPDTIHDDIEIARRLLRKTQEQFDKLEIQVSRLKYPR